MSPLAILFEVIKFFLPFLKKKAAEGIEKIEKKVDEKIDENKKE